MSRTYNIIDADGHVLEPLDMWDQYLDPAFLERAPRLFVDSDGKERLRVEDKVLGGPRGFGFVGAIQSRVEGVREDMKYIEGQKGGFDPHARIADLDLDDIDAVFLYPTLGLFSGAVQDPQLAAAMCRAYNRWLATIAPPTPTGCSESPCCPCSRSSWPSKRCISLATNSACVAASCAPTPITTA